MAARVDELEKEVEEGKAALKVSQSWTNHWAGKIKEVGTESASYQEDWLNLSSQQLDFGADIWTNSQTIVVMEVRIARQDSLLTSLTQWLEWAEVGAIDHIS